MLGLNSEGVYYVLARTPALRRLAEETGLDLSLPATARAGYPVYVTGCEYAALPFVEHADDAARDALFIRNLEYESSYADDGPASLVPCPNDRAFMPFQIAGIRYAMARRHALIGDQMGLGKTAQAVGLASALGAERVLVVCPASVRRQWVREIEAWSVKVPLTYPIMRSLDGVPPIYNWIILSYDLARNEHLHAELMKLDFDLLVLDEAHYLKTVAAGRTRAVFGDLRHTIPALADRADRFLALTGTPLPNRPRECYTLARHLCWDAIDWQSEDDFQYRYNPSVRMMSESGRPFVVEKRGRLPELRARLRCNLMVRRHKSAVLTQLPAKQYELTYVEPNGAIRQALREESLLKIDPTNLVNASVEILGHIAAVRRLMGIAKVPRVVEHVSMLLDGGLEKVVVFAHHTEVIAQLAQKLSSFGVVVIQGSTPASRRADAVSRFVKDPNVGVFIGQLQAAGIGIDGLQQVCSHAVFAEVDWVQGTNEQCVDRLHRIGQAGSVLAQFLIAPGSLDEVVLGRALTKLHVTTEALDGI